ncbi:hypothetical protein KAR91_84110, partial [Candidatus Pacearchaeota archaeon]|nr:hypothetical protein [Candidatus Pacearchaeota archaeon]
MDSNTFFNILWPTIAAAIAPLVMWVKRRLPGDWPIRTMFLSALFNGAALLILNELLKMNIPLAEMWPYITGMMITSQGIHSLKKTA